MALNTAKISIDGKSDGWTLRQAEVVEAVCAPGFMHIEILNDSTDIQPKDMLGKKVHLQIPTTDESYPWRSVKGIVWEWRDMGPFRADDDRQVHRVVVVPPMVLMSQRRVTRAFNAVSANQIWLQLLDEWGEQVPYSDEGPMMSTENEPCARKLMGAQQSNESDLGFLHRILNLMGVFWYNDSSGSEDLPILTLGTNSPAARPWGSGEEYLFKPQLSSIAFGQHMLQWARHAIKGPRIPIVRGMSAGLQRSVPPSNIDKVSQNPSSPDFVGFQWFNQEA
ncbi:MAG: phage late control D family protein, partial [Phycisphaerales bacterium]|nr:phage late control D family protein [Phycisphaerales bacterium]